MRERHFIEILEDLDDPKIGWKPTSQGHGSINKTVGVGVQRILVRKQKKDGTIVTLYDQYVTIENLGIFIVCVDKDDRILLVHNFRMIGLRTIFDPRKNYIANIDNEKLWKEWAKTIGTWTWQLSMGIIPEDSNDNNGDIETLIKHIVREELLREAGAEVNEEEVVVLENLYANQTFIPHPQKVAIAKAIGIHESDPEETEIIKEARFFSLEELDQMIFKGVLNDAPSIAAITMYKIWKERDHS